MQRAIIKKLPTLIVAFFMLTIMIDLFVEAQDFRQPTQSSAVNATDKAKKENVAKIDSQANQSSGFFSNLKWLSNKGNSKSNNNTTSTITTTTTTTTPASTTTFRSTATTVVIENSTTINATQNAIDSNEDRINPVRKQCFSVCQCELPWLIDCSSQNLTNENLPDFAVGNLDEFTHLNLSHNNIDKIDNKLLSIVAKMNKLTHIDLSYNNIHSINGELNRPMTLTLTSLNLSHNKLKTMTENDNQLLQSAKKVTLSGNPWHCVCSPAWATNLPPEIMSTLRCATPTEFREIDFRSLIQKLPSCERSSQLKYGTLFLLSLTAIIMAGFAIVIAVRSGIYSRLFKTNQYGTVYYTKADLSDTDNL